MSSIDKSGCVFLRQREGILGYRELTLTDEGVHEVVNSLSTYRESTVPYATMSPRFSRRRHLPLGWIVVNALVWSGVGVGWLWTGYKRLTGQDFDTTVTVGMLAIFSLAGLAFVAAMISRWWDRVAVMCKYGDAYALTFHAKRPSPSAVEGFLEQLEQRIREAPSAGQESLADELQQLCELHQEGALTAEEFQQAKEMLLGRDRPPIGFRTRSGSTESASDRW